MIRFTYLRPYGFRKGCISISTIVIPAKAGTQEHAETNCFSNKRNEFYQRKLKKAAFLRNELFILGSCFRRNDEGVSRNDEVALGCGGVNG